MVQCDYRGKNRSRQAPTQLSSVLISSLVGRLQRANMSH